GEVAETALPEGIVAHGPHHHHTAIRGARGGHRLVGSLAAEKGIIARRQHGFARPGDFGDARDQIDIDGTEYDDHPKALPRENGGGRGSAADCPAGPGAAVIAASLRAAACRDTSRRSRSACRFAGSSRPIRPAWPS